jgi:D-alanyl-D-alanine carboxypeptidase
MTPATPRLSGRLACLALPAAILVTLGGCDITIVDDEPLEDTDVGERLADNLDDLEDLGMTGVLAELAVGDQRLRARRGATTIDGDEPVPWNARFRTGSVTKSFVAVVILQLVGEGRLSLDDTVERWLPGLVRGDGYDANAITVRMLLQHTSGIFNYTGVMLSDFPVERYQAERLRHYEPEELVAMALTRPADFAPGAGWNYSNTNYILAGMIIEAVTGRAWPAEVAARITGPLGLRATTEPGDDAELPAPHARGYDQFAPGGPLVDVTVLNHSWAGAAGSMVTTTGDLVHFWRALIGGRLLRPQELAAMQETVLATTVQDYFPGARYGLGLMEFPQSCGGSFWSHFGDTLGYSTRLAVSDDGDRVIVASLTSNFIDERLEDVFAINRRLLDDAMCADE